MDLNNPEGAMSLEILDMEDKLAKIRSQVNSKLDNQKHLAVILTAVEENLDEQSNDKTPVAYFVSFCSLLDQSVQNDVIADQSLATAAVYFLDIVLPHTPKPLLISKFGDILTKLAVPLSSSDAEAPLVKSTIGTLESLLLAQDYQRWTSNDSISPQRAMVGLLELSLDQRPKVRRRAQDAVTKILLNPPTSPNPIHPGSALCGKLALERLGSILQKKSKNNKEVNAQIIHCLQLISSITSSGSWPAKSIEPLCDALMEVSRTNDQFIVSSAFSAFEGLFESMNNVINIDRFSQVLDIIFDLKPAINDTHLAASWLAVIAKASECFAGLDASLYIKKFSKILNQVAAFLASDSSDIYSSASHCMMSITSAIPDNFLLQPSQTSGITGEIYEDMDELISQLAEFIEKELLSVKFQHALKEILQFVNEVILKLRSRTNPDFLAIIEIVGKWRTIESEDFSLNKEAEDILASAISVMGPEVVLSILPLSLTSSDSPGRAWLLPILRDNVRFANLGFFQAEILPLVQFFQDKIEKLPKGSVHVKVFETIVDQIWSLLPPFCDLPKDIKQAFSDEFASQLTELMYSHVDMRANICSALRSLAESYMAYSDEVLADDLLMQEELTIASAKDNLQYLASKASNILSVLFNVFSSTSPDTRGFILETIDVYLKIIPKDDLENTFNKVCGLLKNAMDEEANEQKGAKKDVAPKLSITMMDLIVAMAKYVPATSHNALFSIFSTTITSSDALIQKRSYRILTKLAEDDAGKQSIFQFAEEIVKILIATVDETNSSARATRLATINNFIDILPTDYLYFIPAVLQEIIMCTKDNNERTRSLSYQILIKMGNKMESGGVIANSKVPGFDPSTPDTEATLTEFFTMVSGGLGAQSQHMISATITAISCLIFEFKDKLPTEVLVELCSTVELFLTHNSREIAKSAIGFVKVEVLSLPEELVKENLQELLTKLMRWSHEHKGHFKSKVKHIVERLIRKFGYDSVEQAIPEEDRKLVANIKKTRNRAKRKQKEDGEEEQKQPEKKFVSAYEEALQDSDVSDDSDDEDEAPKSNKRSNQYIMEGKDTPLDLLDREAFAKISSSKPRKMTKKQISDKIETQADGKLLFTEQEQDLLASRGSGIDAYLDAVKQAPVRGQKNKLKFKQNKKEDDWSDDEEDARPQKKFRNNSKITKPKKQKFKAKKKL